MMQNFNKYHNEGDFCYFCYMQNITARKAQIDTDTLQYFTSVVDCRTIRSRRAVELQKNLKLYTKKHVVGKDGHGQNVSF